MYNSHDDGVSYGTITRSLEKAFLFSPRATLSSFSVARQFLSDEIFDGRMIMDDKTKLN